MTRGCGTLLKRTLAASCLAAALARLRRRAVARGFACAGRRAVAVPRALLLRVPQRDRPHRRDCLRRAVARRDCCARRHVRAGRAQIARPPDAAAGRRGAEQRRNRRLRGVARGDAGCRVAHARARLRHAASHESHRVRERNPRSAGARGRSRDAVARRWCRARLRQHRERVDGVAVVHRSVLERRAQFERPGDRQPAAARRRRAVHDRQRARPAIPRRRPAARHARRRADRAQFPLRRRIPAQHRQSRDGALGLQPGAQGDRDCAARRPQVLRARHRRRAGSERARSDRRAGRRQDQRAPEEHSVRCDCRRAPARRHVSASLVRGVRPAAVRAGAGRRPRHGADAESARGVRARERDGFEQHAEPRQDFRLSAGVGSGREAVRRRDRGFARARSVPRCVQRRRSTAADAPLRRRRREWRLRGGSRVRARGRARASEVPVSVRAEARRRRRRARRIRCRASSLRRGSPSSYGARSRMPSCSSSRRPTGSTTPKCSSSKSARMLADPRAETLASNFAFQWLGLGELASLAPDPFVFGDVDRNIRDHFVTGVAPVRRQRLPLGLERARALDGRATRSSTKR